MVTTRLLSHFLIFKELLLLTVFGVLIRVNLPTLSNIVYCNSSGPVVWLCWFLACIWYHSRFWLIVICLCVCFYLVFVMPKAEACVRNKVQPCIPSILDALMGPTSGGFSEVRDLFFKEIVEINKNTLNEEGKQKLGEVRCTCWQICWVGNLNKTGGCNWCHTCHWTPLNFPKLSVSWNNICRKVLTLDCDCHMRS